MTAAGSAVTTIPVVIPVDSAPGPTATTQVPTGQPAGESVSRSVTVTGNRLVIVRAVMARGIVAVQVPASVSPSAVVSASRSATGTASPSVTVRGNRLV